MSYILDALKKAESERQLGAVPNLHAVPVTSAPARNAAPWRRPRLLIALAAIALPIAALGWFLSSRPVTTPVSATVAASSSAPVAPVPPIAHMTPSAPAERQPAVDAATSSAAAAAAAKPRAKEAASPLRTAPRKPAPATHAKASPATPSALPEPQVATAPTLDELPEQIRMELPQIAIGGYIYSSNRTERTILINRRLLHEGDRVGADLLLESMTPEGAIFNYKGYRYRMPYR